ncbi:ribosomal protection-like ABC-F family protein [Chloroflexota bacterium]
MLQVSNISKSFGDNTVLDRVSFTLDRADRVGIVGPNGCGKTTLLRIILGEIEPDGGSVRLSPVRVPAGYLAQALEYETGQTLHQVLMVAVDGFTEAERCIESLSEQMSSAEGASLRDLMKAYDRALDTFERLGGYGLEARVETVVAGLGLQDLDPDTPVDILSGGQKTRVGLARLLIADPELLLLDEPTNHLDIEALEWFERFLERFEGAVMMVSHDRAFLDHAATVILELDPVTHTATCYPGNYTAYDRAKARQLEKHWAAYKDQQDRIARLEGNLATRKGYARSIEQGTIDFGPRKIAKMIARKAVVQQRRIERLLDSEERIDRPERTWQMKMQFVNTPSSGQDVLHLEELSMGFGSLHLFENVNLTLTAGDRIALVGRNGSGKTTLARIITGALAPRSGRVRLGSGVKVGYYSQEQEDLEPDSTPYQIIRGEAPLGETEARSFLHYFLFGGDEAFVPVRNLSFGERARLSLARLVVQGCNFLLLDEPINHLDIPSRGRFEQTMSGFPGTILSIVHDRYYINRFATGLWAIEAGSIRVYGGLEDLKWDIGGSNREFDRAR